MPHVVNHVHLKSDDPTATAEWFREAFNVTIVSDGPGGDGVHIVRTVAEGGFAINISSARPGEVLGPSDDGPHHGLEHFGFDSADIEADISRLVALGAVLQEGPLARPEGRRIAFISAPGRIRIELIQR